MKSEDERTEFGRALSDFIHNNKTRAKSKTEVVASLIGTAAAEHIYTKQSRSDFIRICEYAFDETKRFFDHISREKS
jgi:hypothetical protein